MCIRDSAYYAYSQLCQTLGLTPFDPAAHTALTADGFYGTHYAKARTWNAVPDVITYYDLANTLTVWNVTAAGQPAEGQTTGLYDTEKLSVYDKYAMFLHGNNGLSRVQGNGSGRILAVSYTHLDVYKRQVGDDAVQRTGRDHKVCALLRLHQGGDARRHHRHA